MNHKKKYCWLIVAVFGCLLVYLGLLQNLLVSNSLIDVSRLETSLHAKGYVLIADKQDRADPGVGGEIGKKYFPCYSQKKNVQEFEIMKGSDRYRILVDSTGKIRLEPPFPELMAIAESARFKKKE